MQRVLVTGANKGIGLAIAQKVLEHSPHTFVHLGSRDAARGEAAKASLVQLNAEWASRVEVLELDVTSDASVSAAAAQVTQAYVTPESATPLYAIVNNAGIASMTSGIQPHLDTNLYGVKRVCEAFMPLLDSTSGRVVMTSSAAGPNFVAPCNAEKQRSMMRSSIQWHEIEAIANECLSLEGKPQAAAEQGYGDFEKPSLGYVISKALLNCYTMMLAAQHPHLQINAMSPGFIETDLTEQFKTMYGKTAKEMGMLSPAEGTVAAVYLLFAEGIEGNGRYYGSDAKRSPLHKYRSPGAAPYNGDEDVE